LSPHSEIYLNEVSTIVVDKRHPDYETFSADDKTLETKVEILNNEFSKLNAGTDGPKFSFDLLKYSRVRTGRNKRKLKSKYTFNMNDLYNDESIQILFWLIYRFEKYRK
jgi:hypothetical protein